MNYKYGEFTPNQIAETKEKIRKQIFFLLLIVDPRTADNYNVDVNDVFHNVLYTIGGLNDLLNYPQELVTTMSLLNRALTEFQSDAFEYAVYRKLVLDAGNEISKIKEVM